MDAAKKVYEHMLAEGYSQEAAYAVAYEEACALSELSEEESETAFQRQKARISMMREGRQTEEWAYWIRTYAATNGWFFRHLIRKCQEEYERISK